MANLITLGFLFTLAVTTSAIITQLYGMYLCFKKKWYVGAASLFIPGLALVIGGFKLFFKKDLLNG